jgi:DNA-binding NarL/FixJ family response regulator
VAIAEQPDAVVMDLSLPSVNGTEAIANIKRRLPNTRIVVLTAHRADEYVHAALRAGADAYVLKDDSHTELLMALRAIRSGKTYLSPGVCGAVVNNYLTGGRGPANSAFERLTHREREVIKLIAEGKRNKEIASVMCLSPKTIEKHRANLMRKLSLRSATALTAYAFENGLVIR